MARAARAARPTEGARSTAVSAPGTEALRAGDATVLDGRRRRVAGGRSRRDGARSEPTSPAERAEFRGQADPAAQHRRRPDLGPPGRPPPGLPGHRVRPPRAAGSAGHHRGEEQLAAVAVQLLRLRSRQPGRHLPHLLHRLRSAPQHRAALLLGRHLRPGQQVHRRRRLGRIELDHPGAGRSLQRSTRPTRWRSVLGGRGGRTTSITASVRRSTPTSGPATGPT